MGERRYLFDLNSREHEKVNRIQDYPQRARTLKTKLAAWASELKQPGLPDGDLRRESKWYDFYFKEMH